MHKNQTNQILISLIVPGCARAGAPVAVPGTWAELEGVDAPTKWQAGGQGEQKFASVHADVHNFYNLERHLIDRQTCKERGSAVLAKWQILEARRLPSTTERHPRESGSLQTDSTAT